MVEIDPLLIIVHSMLLILKLVRIWDRMNRVLKLLEIWIWLRVVASLWIDFVFGITFIWWILTSTAAPSLSFLSIDDCCRARTNRAFWSMLRLKSLLLVHHTRRVVLCLTLLLKTVVYVSIRIVLYTHNREGA